MEDEEFTIIKERLQEAFLKELNSIRDEDIIDEGLQEVVFVSVLEIMKWLFTDIEYEDQIQLLGLLIKGLDMKKEPE